MEAKQKEGALFFELNIDNKEQEQALKELIEKNFYKEQIIKPIIVDIKGPVGIMTEKLIRCREMLDLIETAKIEHRETPEQEPFDFCEYLPPHGRLFNIDYNPQLCNPVMAEKQKKGISIFVMYRCLQINFDDDFLQGPLILYSKNDLVKIEGGLLLLHEIGHTRQEEALFDKASGLYNEIAGAWKKAIIKNRTKPAKDEIMIKVFSDIYAAMPVPIALWQEWIDFKSKIERGAWAFALKILRSQRKKGHDLAPGLTREDLDRKLHGGEFSALGSYEFGIQKQQIAPEKKKIKGKFVKK